MKTIIVASDHGGFESKQTISFWLKAQGYRVIDAGATSYDRDDDYPDFVAAALCEWRRRPTARLLLWCRSGVGVDITANRQPGIYCCLAISPAQVSQSTRHDSVNALALAADFFSIQEQEALIEAFLMTKPSTARRYAARLEKIEAYARDGGRHCSRPKRA